MRRILEVSKALIKGWIRSRTGFFFSIVFPVMLLVIFGSIFGNPQNISFTIYVQNKDLDDNGNATQISKAFIESLNNSGVFKVKSVPSDVDALSFSRSSSGLFENRRVVVIPKGFQSYVLNYTEISYLKQGIAQIVLLLNSSYLNETQKQFLNELLNWMEERLKQIKLENISLEIYISKVDPAYEQLINILNNFIQRFGAYTSGGFQVPVKEVEIGAKPLKAADYYVPSYIAFTLMSNALFGLVSVISDYRRRGILTRVIATPLKKWEWLIGIFLQQLVMLALASILLIVVGYLLFNTSLITSPYYVMLSMIVVIMGVLTFTSIAVVIGTVIKNPDTAATAGTIIGFPMMFLSGVFFPIELMPSYLQAVAAVLPLYYLNVALRETMVMGILNLTPMAVLVMLILGVVFIALSLKLIKWSSA